MPLNYEIKLETVSRGYDRETCWVQTRAGAIPPRKPGANPTVVLTMQKLLLSGSDVFYGICSTYSDDLGASWSDPQPQANLARQPAPPELAADFSESVLCDFWPKWHNATGTLLGTGHTAYYSHANEVVDERPRETGYSVYDSVTHTWGQQRTLRMPDARKFRNAGAGCTQRVDLPNGDILLPIYFRTESGRYAATVVCCSFDGQELTYREHGSELTVDAGRGLYEPSLTYFGGRYYLTLRNDEHGYVAVGDDGLHFAAPQMWRFDDGQELSNYNTQQHWVAHSDGLFLVYTRRGLDNDHVFRHRSPLVMAQVDPERGCIIRDTERTVIPERGARLGNFGVTMVNEYETWITESEWMQNSGEWARVMLQKLKTMYPEQQEWLPRTRYHSVECEQFGSDGSVYACRLLWDKPNQLFGCL
jgi:hypothetical protein